MKKNFFAVFNIRLSDGIIQGCDFSGSAEEKDITEKNIAMEIAKQANCNWTQIEFTTFRIL